MMTTTEALEQALKDIKDHPVLSRFVWKKQFAYPRFLLGVDYTKRVYINVNYTDCVGFYMDIIMRERLCFRCEYIYSDTKEELNIVNLFNKAIDEVNKEFDEYDKMRQVFLNVIGEEK